MRERDRKKRSENGEETATLPIGETEIGRALEILQKYKIGKAGLESRIIQNEEGWTMRYSSEESGEGFKKGSAWLFNSIANKHADAMDNFPEPCILPREKSDVKAAKELSSIIPVILDQNRFDEVYSRVWYDKLKYGTGCYGVFWNPEMCGGLGDVEIVPVDLLNLFWESGISDIQKSRNLFHVELWDNDILEEKYPFLKGKLSNPTFECSKYLYDDTVDTSGKSAVIDWYYKKNMGGRSVLHLCKFCAGNILFASENEAGYEGGFYAHGKYPFFLDSLYPVQGTPCGFGFVDIMKEPQAQIDALNEAIMKSARMASTVRYFIRNDGSVNEEEFADWSAPLVHVQGSKLGDDSLKQIVVAPLSSLYVSIMNNKVEELKETSGNRDFNQGGTTGGITAASAIAALQEAGNKLSRDMINRSYSVYSSIVSLVVELIREFYDTPRFFRILGENGAFEFISYVNSGIVSQGQGEAFGVDLGSRLPIFDVSVKAQKQAPFAKVSQNELAKEFFGMGFFNPEMAPQALLCMSMMEFEGKDELMQKISAMSSSEGGDAASAEALLRNVLSGGASPDAVEGGSPTGKGNFLNDLNLESAVRDAVQKRDGRR